MSQDSGEQFKAPGLSCYSPALKRDLGLTWLCQTVKEMHLKEKKFFQGIWVVCHSVCQYITKYFENKLIDFHQILYMHSYRQDLAWDFYTSFFAPLYQS